MANRLMEFLLRKNNTENGATNFAPLVKVEGANSAGLMPDGSFAQTPYVESQPVIEHIQIDENGQPIPNAQYHSQRGGGLGTKLRYKAVNALFGQEPVNADTVNAQDIENLGGTIQDNPRIGGVFNDLANGYRENRLNGFNVRNWGNNELPYDREKGLAYRIGEGVGTVGRTLNRGANAFGKGLRKVGQFAETPLGRGLIVGGLVLGTGGGALPALAFGGATSMGNQSNRMKDRAYRDSLINTAQQSRMSQNDWVDLSPEERQAELNNIANQVNSYRGYIGDDVYGQIIQAQQLRDNAQYRNMLLQSNMRNQEEMMKWRIAEAERQARQDAFDNSIKQQQVAQGWANVENDKQKANSGRVMPASSATGLSGTQQGINQMTTLMEQIPKYAKRGLAGPVGSLRRFNPYDADAQAFQQYVNTYKQVIGKGLEGGVLRKEDEAKYEKIIPRMGDTEEVLMRKAQQLQQMLIEKYNTDLEALYNAGYDTGNFSYYGLQSNTGNGKSGVTKSGVKYEVIE